MHITLADLAAMHSILDDLWNRHVTPENLHEWLKANDQRILAAKVRADLMLQDAGLQSVTLIPAANAV